MILLKKGQKMTETLIKPVLADVFESGDYIVVRIPKVVNFKDIKAFNVENFDGNLLLKPTKQNKTWQNFFDNLSSFNEKLEIPQDLENQERNFGKVFA